MPQVKEELEPEANHVASIPNGHSNGDANGGTNNGTDEAATIIKAAEDNQVGQQVPMVAAAE